MTPDLSFEITNESQLEDADPIESFNCDDCDFIGKTKRGYTRHRNSVHGDGDKAPKATGTASRSNKKLREDLEATLTTISMGLVLTGNQKLQYDGQVVAVNTEAMATAWASLAAKNKQVDKILRNLTGGFAYGEVLTATAMMVLPILANHGLLPASVGQVMGPMVQNIANDGT